MKNNILEITHLSKNYQDNDGEIEAIKDINLKISEGEFVVIVGPSGCGKSTLLSILANLDKKSGGDLKYNKKEIKVGYMLQKDSLFPWLNILDNCLLGLKIKGKVKEKDKEYVLKLLDMYGLNEFKNKFPNSLSGGMRQRVALIRTLATKPDILLLDEPFSALDAMTRVMLADDVYKMVKDLGKTAIMVTHDIGEAVSIASKVVVLTERPCVVKKVYDINYDNRSTPFNNRKEKEFNYYYEKIWRDLDVKL